MHHLCFWVFRVLYGLFQQVCGLQAVRPFKWWETSSASRAVSWIVHLPGPCLGPALLTHALFLPCACFCWAECAWTSSAVWWLQVPSFVWWVSWGSALIVVLYQMLFWGSSELVCYSVCHWFGLCLYVAGFDTLLYHFHAMPRAWLHAAGLELLETTQCTSVGKKYAIGLKWWGLIVHVVSKCLQHCDRLLSSNEEWRLAAFSVQSNWKCMILVCGVS